MKYIKLQDPEGGMPRFIFTLAPTTHAEITEGFIKRGFKPISAGYFDPATGSVFGASESLKIKADFDDTKIILAMINAMMKTAPERPTPVYSEEVKRFAAGEPRDHSNPGAHVLDLHRMPVG